MAMRIDANRVAQAFGQSVKPADTMKDGVQAATLRKALDTQRQEADELLRRLEPKGRLLDIRV